MGKIFSGIWHEIRMAFKTVTFHFKQYFCFFLAILAMEVMFGIIVMSASNNLYQYEKTVNDDYDYHFSLTNLTEGQYNYFIQNQQLKMNPSYTVSYDGTFVYVYIETEAIESVQDKMSLEEYYDNFAATYIKKAPGTNDNPIVTQFSPLYNLESSLSEMRLQCAGKLFVLALVSIAVIILLFNIRLNHFKFTYGIYMSFGADTRKLFSTSFWEMMMIGVLTLIPAAGIAIPVDYLFYSVEDYKYHFAPQLMAFCLLFIIPIILLSVFLPIKYTAVKPPLKLLLAEDNSNLVSSPRISAQMGRRKFPGGYETLGLWRFRRYCATLVGSSVLFAAIFVWISFYQGIYAFNMDMEQAEFTVNSKKEVNEYTEWQLTSDSKDVTEEYYTARSKVYTQTSSEIDRAEFEKFYTDDYVINRNDDGYVTTVYARSNMEKDLSDKYVEARNKVLTKDILDSLQPYFVNGDELRYNAYNKTLANFEEYLNTERYEWTGEGNNRRLMKKEQVKVVEEVYHEISDNDMILLDNLVSGYGSLYKQCVKDAFTSNSYVAFNKSDVKMFSGFQVNQNDKSQKITNDADYFVADRDAINYIKNNYNYEGDLDRIYETGANGERYIAITETAANRGVLKIDVGDTVQISVLQSIDRQPSGNLESDKYLEHIIKYGEFRSTTFVVCAVIKNMPTTENIAIYMDAADFEQITGEKENYNQVLVYVDSTLQSSEIDTMYTDLVKWGNGDGEMFATVTWNNAVADSRSDREMRNLPVIQTIALFSLILSPLFWFFSQIMFFGKRQGEFEILRAMGAVEKEIKKIFRKDGLLLALTGIVATVIMSLIGLYVIYRFNMSFVARFDVQARTLYRFEMPWIPLGIAVAVTALCGYFSSIIPYRIDRKRYLKKKSTEYGDGSEEFSEA